METAKQFLELSSIHGLYYLATTRKWVRLCWTLIVFGGFLVVGYLILETFDSWSKSPASTSIESLPISELRFPTITVCPPKNSFLNLNYDIMKSDQMNIEKTSTSKDLEGKNTQYRENHCLMLTILFHKTCDKSIVKWIISTRFSTVRANKTICY